MNRLFIACGLMFWLLTACQETFYFFSDAGLKDNFSARTSADASLPEDAGPQYDAGPTKCELAACKNPYPLCHPDGRCVECLTPADCGGVGPCDARTGRCALGCTRDGEEEEDQACNPLFFPLGCRDKWGAPRCTACLKSDDCRDYAPYVYCELGRAICVECLLDAHCGKGHCNLTTGLCEGL